MPPLRLKEDEFKQNEVNGNNVTTGSGFTVTVTDALSLQPFALVTVTKYLVVTNGLTVRL